MIQIDDEFKALIPPLANDEYLQLKESILDKGCRDALVLWDDVLVDGHNRYLICTENDIEFKTINHDFDSRNDAKIWMITNQFARRNITNFVRAELALRLKPLIAKKAKINQIRKPKSVCLTSDKQSAIDTKKELAKKAGVGHDTIAKTETILKSADNETKEKLRAGDPSISINKAYQEIKKTEKRVERISTINDISQENEELSLTKTYPVIYADPPWQYQYSEADSRKIENHYPTMTLQDICELPINKIATDDSILFLWATSPKLEEALQVMKSWGFKYTTCAIWDKQKKGLGYYFRQNHELLLIGKKGNIPTPKPENRPDSVISLPRTEHSEKPHEFYEIIENMYPEFSKIELFSRNIREGWDNWGNQSNGT